VSEGNGTIVGTMHLTYIHYLSRQASKRMIIESVRVDSKARGHGVGNQMFEWAFARGREKGCVIVQLTTDISRKSAQHFYERLGFKASHVGMKLYL
jgi:ribosomal protein S18 acetylase RimI-like enzyme